MSRAAILRLAAAGVVGLALTTLAGCSGEAESTDVGRQADMKVLEETAAANDAAASASKRSRPRSNIGVMPP